MKNPIEGLEPSLLWQHFYALSQIPRCSKNEAQVTQYVLDVPFGRDRALDDLYTPEATEMLRHLRHQIQIAQGRPEEELEHGS